RPGARRPGPRSGQPHPEDPQGHGTERQRPHRGTAARRRRTGPCRRGTPRLYPWRNPGRGSESPGAGCRGQRLRRGRPQPDPGHREVAGLTRTRTPNQPTSIRTSIMNTNPAHSTDDTRIIAMKELLSPRQLIGEFPITPQAEATVLSTRQALHDILHDADDRIFVVTGPCSIHDTKAALEYADRLRPLIDRYRSELCLVKIGRASCRERV